MSSGERQWQEISHILARHILIFENETRKGKLSRTEVVKHLAYICSRLGKHHFLYLLCDILESTKSSLNDEKNILLHAVHNSIFHGYIGCALQIIHLNPDLRFVRFNKVTAVELFLDNVPCYEMVLSHYLEKVLFVWGNNRNFLLGLDDDSDKKVPRSFPSNISYEKLQLTSHTGMFSSLTGSQPRLTFTGKTPWGISAVRPLHLTFHMTESSVATIRQTALVSDRKGTIGHHLLVLDHQNMAWCLTHLASVTPSGLAWPGGPNVEQSMSNMAPFSTNDLPVGYAWLKVALPKSMPALVGISAGDNYVMFYSQQDIYACGVQRGQFTARHLALLGSGPEESGEEPRTRHVQYVASLGPPKDERVNNVRLRIVALVCGSHAVLVHCLHQPTNGGVFETPVEGTGTHSSVELLHNYTKRLLLPRCREVHQMQVMDPAEGKPSTSRFLVLYTTALLKRILSVWNAWEKGPTMMHIVCEQDGVLLIPQRFSASVHSFIFCTENGLVFTAPKNWCSPHHMLQSEGGTPPPQGDTEADDAWQLPGLTKSLMSAPRLLLPVMRRTHLIHVRDVVSDPAGHSFVALCHVPYPTPPSISLEKTRTPFADIFLQEPFDMIATCQSTGAELYSHRFVWCLQSPLVSSAAHQLQEQQGEQAGSTSTVAVLRDGSVELSIVQSLYCLHFPTLKHEEVMCLLQFVYGIPVEDGLQGGEWLDIARKLLLISKASDTKSQPQQRKCGKASGSGGSGKSAPAECAWFHSKLNLVHLDAYFPDVVLLCPEGGTVSAHKVMLSASSDMWQSQLSGRWDEDEDDYTGLSRGRDFVECSYSAEVMTRLLVFLYTDSAEHWAWPVDCASSTGSGNWLACLNVCGEVLDAADFYLISKIELLKMECSRKILQLKITKENVAGLLSFAVAWDLVPVRVTCCDRILFHVTYYLDAAVLGKAMSSAAWETLSNRHRQLKHEEFLLSHMEETESTSEKAEETEPGLLVQSCWNALRKLGKGRTRQQSLNESKDEKQVQGDAQRFLELLEQLEMLLLEAAEEDSKLTGPQEDGGDAGSNKQRKTSGNAGFDVRRRKNSSKSAKSSQRQKRDWRKDLLGTKQMAQGPAEVRSEERRDDVMPVEDSSTQSSPRDISVEVVEEPQQIPPPNQVGPVSLKKIMELEAETRANSTSPASVVTKKAAFKKPSQRQRKAQQELQQHESTGNNGAPADKLKSVAPWASVPATASGDHDKPTVPSPTVSSTKQPSLKEIMLLEEIRQPMKQPVSSIVSNKSKSTRTAVNRVSISEDVEEIPINKCEDKDPNLRFVTVLSSSSGRRNRHSSLENVSADQQDSGVKKCGEQERKPWGSPASGPVPSSKPGALAISPSNLLMSRHNPLSPSTLSHFKNIQEEQAALETLTNSVKPLELIQIEERALAEFQEFYRVSTSFDMNIRVQMVPRLQLASTSASRSRVGSDDATAGDMGFPLKWRG